MGKVFCSDYREIPCIESLCRPKFRGKNSDYREKVVFREIEQEQRRAIRVWGVLSIDDKCKNIFELST